MISQVLKHEREQEKEDPKMKENGTMNEKLLVPYLPEEIILEIHSRLPPKSLSKFRCVSKSWSVLYNNPKLIDMMKFYFNIMIVHARYIYSVDSESLSSKPLLDGMEKIHCPDVKYYHRTRFVGCCNGLVCIHIVDRGMSTDFRIWNPSTGDCKRLPNPPDQFEFDFSLHNYLPRIGYGFGYDSKSDDYKFVCITTDLHCKLSAVQIYSLRSDSWKQVNRTHNIPWLLSSTPETERPQYGVFCNGTLHWQSSSSSKALIALCMTDEIIRGIPPPENSNVEKFNYSVSIDVVDGCLSMLYGNETLGIEVWLMKDYGKKESWKKIYSISKLTSLDEGGVWNLCLRRIECLKSGEMLLEVCYHGRENYKKALVLYDPKNEMSRTLIEDDDEWGSNSLSFHSYVKSSVSVSSSTIAG